MDTLGTEPDYILLNSQPMSALQVSLEKGWHRLILAFADVPTKAYSSGPNSRDERLRSAMVFYPDSEPQPIQSSRYSGSPGMRWYQTHHLRYSTEPTEHVYRGYRFHAAPGMERMTFGVFGDSLEVWVDGVQVPDNFVVSEKKEGDLQHYTISLDSTYQHTALVSFRLKPQLGYNGGDVLNGPIRLQCGEGLLKAGNWSDEGALRYYAGGMYYRKEVEVPETYDGQQIYLEFGKVVASCEVKVNGQPAGILMGEPYRCDVTSLMKKGVNQLEVLVYSTLSNHYQTISSAYRGEPEAGIFGPVFLEFRNE